MVLLNQLEKIPVGRFHYRLLLLAGVGWAFDAMDTGIISFVLPLLIKEWQLTGAEGGMLGSVGLAGMAIGAVISGFFADRWGRKKIFTWTMILYGLTTGLSAVSPNYEWLLVCRFLVGLGLGGELPVAATWITEFSPAGYRGRFMVMLESFWAVGWILAACIAYFGVPLLGWRVALALGAIPALYAGIVRKHMPESVRYLVQQGRIEEAKAIVDSVMGDTNLPSASEEVGTKFINREEIFPSLSTLWSGSYRSRTVMLWFIWFGIIFSYYGIFMWLPTFVYQQGFTVVKTFEYILIMTLAQLPGYVTAALLVDYIGRKYTLSSFLLLSGIFAYCFSQSTTVMELLISGSLMSFFNLGAWGVLYTYTPELYPTAIRSFGSGWAAGVGRIGGIFAPILVGYMMASGIGGTTIFAMFATVFIGIAGIVALMGIESKQQTLEEI